MARFYLEVVKQCQPQGPYYLGGYCFGGNVAYEMARQLEQQGEPVALVALLDSAPANAGYESFTWWRPKFLWRFSRNLSYWLQDFAALPPRDRQSFFKRKTRAFLRKIFRRIRRSEASFMVDIEEVIDPSHIPAQELELWQIHLQALTKHVEQSYAGEVVLLRTRGQPLFCSLEEDFCWGNLARDGVKVILVPGSHESVFVEPNVQYLAKELDLCLLQAQARAGQAFESKL
jgi:thioesterase domain-containing protein